MDTVKAIAVILILALSVFSIFPDDREKAKQTPAVEAKETTNECQ